MTVHSAAVTNRAASRNLRAVTSEAGLLSLGCGANCLSPGADLPTADRPTMSDDHEHIAEGLREFIVGHYPRAAEISVSVDDALLESGVIDSLGILQLVNFIEDSFGILIAEEDFDPENFTSITTISRFIARKQG